MATPNMDEQSIVSIIVALIGAAASIVAAWITVRGRAEKGLGPDQKSSPIQDERKKRTMAQRIVRWILLGVLYLGGLYFLGVKLSLA
jgi:hypothetical protein